VALVASRRAQPRTDNLSAVRHRSRAWRPRIGRTVRPATFDTLIATVPIAVLTFDFDPNVQLFGDLTVRWGSIALVGAIIAALILAGLLARAGGLRPDDVAFVAVGIVPGAVLGARLGYLIVHEQAFASAPDRLLDPSVGGLELGLAVVGGFLTGSYVASLLGPSVGRWLHLAALPVLLVLGAGKLAMVLTGTGQGLPSDAEWATAYLGAGPWGSLVPALPSQPSQAYEGLGTLAVLAILTVAVLLGAFRSRDGRLFFVAIGLWAVIRAIVSTTWRDPVVAAGLNASGLIAVGIAVGCAVALVVLTVRRRGAATDAPAAGPGPAMDALGNPIVWSDPETRQRF
jgi:phosphatidylglycerol:prolipoprotein diacylglycerol transferase